MVELMIRQPALAGTWYSGEPVALRSELNLHLAAVPRTAVPGRLIGLVAPHAGLMYSGRVAAHCFALLRESADPTVVLLGPSHHLGFDGIAVYERGAWDTPLGRTLVNEEVASALLQARAPFFSGADKHRYEHALEMQLPFLQYVAPHARIVPLLMGGSRRRRSTPPRRHSAHCGQPGTSCCWLRATSATITTRALRRRSTRWWWTTSTASTPAGCSRASAIPPSMRAGADRW